MRERVQTVAGKFLFNRGTLTVILALVLVFSMFNAQIIEKVNNFLFDKDSYKIFLQATLFIVVYGLFVVYIINLNEKKY